MFRNIELTTSGCIMLVLLTMCLVFGRIIIESQIDLIADMMFPI
jgi:hypothetical protein